MKKPLKALTAVLSAAVIMGSVGVMTAGAAVTDAQSVAAAADSRVGALETPQITSTKSENGGVRIYWNAVSGAYGYRVFYLGRSGWRGMGNTTSTSFVDDDVNGGSTYTYTVRCIDKDGNFVSDYNHDGFKGTYIAPPELTYTESVEGGVEINWKPSKGATKYRVFYKGSTAWRSMGDTTETSFIDADVTSGNSYTYTVRCVNDEGTEFVSGYDTKGIRGTYVAAPQITGYESTSQGVKLSWEPVKGAYAYRVYYKGRSGWVRFAQTTGTTALDDDVNSGSTYTYTVRCIDEDGDFVSGYNHDGWKATYIGTPKITAAKNTTEGIQMSWQAVKGAVDYRVYVKRDSAWVAIGNTTDTSFVHDGVFSNTAYTYTVRCVNEQGDWVSDYDRTGYTQTFYNTPYITRYTADTDSNVTIYWEAVDGAAQYRVFYYTAGAWKGLGNTASTSFKIKQNPVATTYTVRAMDKDGSFISDYDHVGVVARRKSYAVDIDTTKPVVASHKINEDLKVVLTWDPVPRAAAYYVYLETEDGGLKKVGESEERTVSINRSQLGTSIAGKTFVFRVRAVSKYGAFISDYNQDGYPVTYPKGLDVKGVFTTEAKNVVNVSWNEVQGAQTYKITIYRGGSYETSEIETSRTSYNIRLEDPTDYYLITAQAYGNDGSIIAVPGEGFEVNP